MMLQLWKNLTWEVLGGKGMTNGYASQNSVEVPVGTVKTEQGQFTRKTEKDGTASNA